MANDKVRGERVLVHILDCATQKPNQPTVQWVLDAFRAAAPEPVGLVLETGRYSGTLYGYLVTEMPEEAALKDWLRRYNDHTRDTQESLAPGSRTAEKSPPPAAKVASLEPPSPPVQFTQVFRDFESQTKAKTPGPPKAAEPPSPLPLPNLSVAGDPSGLHAAPAWEEANQPISAPSKRQEHNFGSSAGSFRSEFGSRKPTPETMPPAPKDAPKLGEFTSFFQGPFRPDGPSEMPAVSPREMEPSRKSVGDFTAMFGPVAPQEQSAPSSDAPRSDVPSSGFTGLFNSLENPSRTLSGTPLSGGPPALATDVPTTLPSPRQEPPPAPLPPVYVAPTPPVFPTVQPPPAARPSAPVSPASSSGGATRAFSTTGNEPAPSPPPVPSGPSAYTQIISVKPKNPEGAPGAQAKSPGASAPPAFTMPPLPSMAPPPLPPPVHMPPPPPMPKIVFTPPSAPKLPAVQVPPPVSWWPLILTLTVLFFIAVLLVLYYALKH